MKKKVENDTEYVIKRLYKIYKMIEGLLKEPTIDRWSGSETIFPSFNSIEEAENAFKESDEVYGEFAIITVITKEMNWDYEENKQSKLSDLGDDE